MCVKFVLSVFSKVCWQCQISSMVLPDHRHLFFIEKYYVIKGNIQLFRVQCIKNRNAEAGTEKKNNILSQICDLICRNTENRSDSTELSDYRWRCLTFITTNFWHKIFGCTWTQNLPFWNWRHYRCDINDWLHRHNIHYLYYGTFSLWISR